MGGQQGAQRPAGPKRHWLNRVEHKGCGLWAAPPRDPQDPQLIFLIEKERIRTSVRAVARQDPCVVSTRGEVGWSSRVTLGAASTWFLPWDGESQATRAACKSTWVWGPPQVPGKGDQDRQAQDLKVP